MGSMHNQSSNSQQPSTSSLVAQIKQQDQDFEWYPTTEEILSVVKADIDKMIDDYDIESSPSILDCGAGDGRSLMYLTKGSKYAIEKAKPLISAMDKSIFVIGAEFHQQVLMDKGVAITYSNPPYSQFAEWSTKIIRETRSAYVYLVIPERWKDNESIKAALEIRSAEAEVIGSFDFLNAERKARAKVDIVKVLMTPKTSYRSRENCSKTDPFDIWFEENFKIKTSREREYDHVESSIDKEEVNNELVKGNDIVTILTTLYERDLAQLMKNYQAFGTLNPDLLDELGVSFEGVREGLKQKISGLKNLYWQELFNNLNKITDKLTQSSREAMLSKLTSRTDVDFNSDNVYAVVIWVIKNANHYFDDQLVHLVERMVEKANIVMYKSNQKMFRDEQWSWNQKPDGLDRFLLEHRVVLERVGGLAGGYSWEISRHNGLSERAYYFLMDILTIATNLGFDTAYRTRPHDFEWESNKSCDFYCYDHVVGKEIKLMSVKAFKNGNLHVKANPAFMLKLNVEFGRLKGWLKTAQEAASELDIDIVDAAGSFNTNLQLTGSSLLQLGFKDAA